MPLKQYEKRQYFYGVAVAIIGLLVGVGLIDGILADNLIQVVAAVLLIIPGAAPVIATINARPSAHDEGVGEEGTSGTHTIE